MQSSEVIRKVAMTYALRRLHAGDVHSAKPVLAAAAAGGLPDAALSEESAVAVTLARRLAAMNSGKDVNPAAAPGTPLWRHAVDGVLLRACTSGIEVHEEVLRLVLAAAGAMRSDALAALVEATLHVTRKSRKHHKRRAKQIVYEYEPLQGTRGVIAGRRGTGMGLLHGHGSGVFGGGAGSSGDLAGWGPRPSTPRSPVPPFPRSRVPPFNSLLDLSQDAKTARIY